MASTWLKYSLTFTQIEDYHNTNSYDEFGWNFYTPEQMTGILAELEKYIGSQDKSDRIIDF
ncbi:MAG: hypothetical protein II433_01170, partial [Acidaminococcaceae bacterium]|nr:hypothetical protein [Acidaminococcaceae bacterium]